MKVNGIDLKMRVCICSRLSGLVLAFALLLGSVATVSADTVTVFAAASLKNVLEAVGERFSSRTGHEIVFSFAGSSALVRQIEQGAPADLFISANSDWMDRLAASKFIDAQSRFDLAANRLVLVSAEPSNASQNLDDLEVLSRRLKGKRIAMGFVDAVPAGIYGKAALQNLGLWDDVKAAVVQSDNVRSTLALVALGAAPLGIVYETDAAIEPRVHIIGRFAEATHPPIRYPAARLSGSASKVGSDFYNFLKGEEAAELFEQNGFLPVTVSVSGDESG